MTNKTELPVNQQIAQLEYQLRCVEYTIEKTRSSIIAAGRSSRSGGRYLATALTDGRRSQKSLVARIDALRQEAA